MDTWLRMTLITICAVSIVLAIVCSIILTYPVRLHVAPYRIGDAIKRYDNITVFLHKLIYRNRVAGRYLRKTKERNNVRVLNEVVDEFPQYHTPSNDRQIFIHVRSGDVITKDITGYTMETEQYEKLINQVIPSPEDVESIVIISGSHKSKQLDEGSMDHINKIKQTFERHGFIVSTLLDRDADLDFITMATSNAYVPSAGGFSNLIASLVLFRGGTVYRIPENW